MSGLDVTSGRGTVRSPPGSRARVGSSPGLEIRTERHQSTRSQDQDYVRIHLLLNCQLVSKVKFLNTKLKYNFNFCSDSIFTGQTLKLFKLVDDPEERINLAINESEMAQRMLARLLDIAASLSDVQDTDIGFQIN